MSKPYSKYTKEDVRRYVEAIFALPEDLRASYVKAMLEARPTDELA